MSTTMQDSGRCRIDHAVRDLADALRRRLPDAKVVQMVSNVSRDQRVMHAAIAFSYDDGGRHGRIYADAADGLTIRWMVAPGEVTRSAGCDAAA